MLSCRTVALLDPSDDRPLPVNCERIPFTSDRFYQDGRFLDAIPAWERLDSNKYHWPILADDDVVILADADAVIQRDLDDSERAALEDLGDAVMVGYNVRKGQLGCEELSMAGMKGDVNDVARAFRVTPDSLRECHMYNWGLVAAKVSTWKHLRNRYNEMTEGLDPQVHFRHPTWMQYLLCVALHEYKIPVVEMDYVMHSHGHFGLYKDTHGIKHRKLYYTHNLVFYAHYVPGVSY